MGAMGEQTGEIPVKLKKVETGDDPRGRIKSTYAVLVGGLVVGHVHKFVEPTSNRAASRYGHTPSTTCWGWTRPGVPDDPFGCDRRSDAIDRLIESLS